jgi:hypothetical protein
MGEPGAPPPSREGEAVGFAEAATEYLRFVGEVRRIDPQTLADYRGVVEARSSPRPKASASPAASSRLGLWWR